MLVPRVCQIQMQGSDSNSDDDDQEHTQSEDSGGLSGSLVSNPSNLNSKSSEDLSVSVGSSKKQCLIPSKPH